MCQSLKSPSLLTAVLVLAAVLRVAVLAWDSGQLQIDRDGYLGLAESLADGRGLSLPGTTRPTAYRPPLYPGLLSVVLLGTRPLGPLAVWLGIAGLQLAAGVGTVWLTWRLARFRLPATGAVAAACLVAIDPLLVQYTARPMTETVCAFLAVLLLVQIERLRLAPADSSGIPVPGGNPGDGQGENPGSVARHGGPMLPCLLAGAVFGLCVLCRPTFWIPGGLAAGLVVCRSVWLAAGGRPGRGRDDAGLSDAPQSGTWRTSLQQLAGVIAGAACVVLPWLIRNWLVLGVPVLATTHGGYTLLLANNPVFYSEVVEAPAGTVWAGDSLTAWQDLLEQQLRQDGLDPHDEPSRDRWMRQRAFSNMAAAPELALRAAWLKLRRFFSIYPLASAEGGLRKYAAVAAALVFLAGYLLVLVAVLRHGRSLLWRFWPGLVLLAGFCAVHAAFWTNARMRAPVVPVLAVLAAAALVSPRQAGGQPGESAVAGSARKREIRSTGS